VEELRVSLFAQELGTAEPVSVQKLERALAELRQGVKPVAAVEQPKPREATPLPVTTTKPKAPLKSFGSLDALFRK
jgi:ATP-dependent helicase HrpA